MLHKFQLVVDWGNILVDYRNLSLNGGERMNRWASEQQNIYFMYYLKMTAVQIWLVQYGFVFIPIVDFRLLTSINKTTVHLFRIPNSHETCFTFSKPRVFIIIFSQYGRRMVLFTRVTMWSLWGCSGSPPYLSCCFDLSSRTCREGKIFWLQQNRTIVDDIQMVMFVELLASLLHRFSPLVGSAL